VALGRAVLNSRAPAGDGSVGDLWGGSQTRPYVIGGSEHSWQGMGEGAGNALGIQRQICYHQGVYASVCSCGQW